MRPCRSRLSTKHAFVTDDSPDHPPPPPPGRCYTVGLTGGIASGKTFVAGLFFALGVPVIDADDAARAVMMPGGEVLMAIAHHFGDEYIADDGTLDRRRLRAAVFAEPNMLRELEGLTHPAIRQALKDWQAAQTAPYCIVANAILLESGMNAMCDRVLVVDAPEESQLRRLIGRDGISDKLAREMMSLQISRADRLARADDVLENATETSAVVGEVERLHAHFLGLARAHEQARKRDHDRTDPA